MDRDDDRGGVYDSADEGRQVTREDVLRAFTVDLAAGRLFWKALALSKSNGRFAGKEAGGLRPNRRGKAYWYIRLGGVQRRRGWLIFLVAHGRFPSPFLDHINGQSLDDRITNLREATRTQNAWNHKRRTKRSPYPMGVRLLDGRFQARLQVNKQPLNLGTFNTVAEAEDAYRAAREKYFGEFA